MDAAQFKTFVSKVENHEFCEVRFNKNSSGWGVEVFFRDIPIASEAATLVFETDKSFGIFVEQLIDLGWRQFWNLAGPENYVAQFLRLPQWDPQYEYAVLNCTVNLDEQQAEKLIRLDALHHLGKANKSLMFSGTPKPNFKDYASALQYLEAGKWEFMHRNDYPSWSKSPTVRMRLSYFRCLPSLTAI
jgi:hypothetical protein